MPTYHTIIIGAGASGLFCAGSFEAPKIILDHNPRPGLKVAVSGGGKCNFTNRLVTASDYQSTSKHFCKNALAAFKPQHFTELLQKSHITYEEREEGKLFAKHAGDIVRLLVQRAKAAHTDFSLSTEVLDIRQQEEGFCVHTSNGSLYAQHVVLACGGLSYPRLGASSWGIQMARKLDLPIIEQRPALCGLVVQKPLRTLCKTLAGNSTDVIIRLGKQTFTGSLLFTHEGFSGPAILSASLFWQEDMPITINFLPNVDVRTFIAHHKNSTKNLSSLLPLRGSIAQTLLGTLDQPLSNASKTDIDTITRMLNGFTFIPAGSSGSTKAEVTAGGIDTQSINPSTFEVKQIPGLYVIGELLDVTGKLGGYNLHWAWASGFCAAKHLSKIS